jgi:3-dehydroquinate synthase
LGENILRDALCKYRGVFKGGKIALVTDENVGALYLRGAAEAFRAAGFAVRTFAFPAGEESKNLRLYGRLLSFFAEAELGRGDAAVALGGGVTGDLCGFAAATYMRGIRYVQLPTTLLAAVDSSVGGKTGVDLPEGKNLAGAFWQPALVVCDTGFFSTLPEKELRCGMAEIVKTALLAGGRLYELLQGRAGNPAYIPPTKDKNLTEILRLCIEYKGGVVGRDEFEGGERMLLNLGHTAGHAIERESGYTLSHGEAVGMGLQLIAGACFRRKILPEKDYAAAKKLLEYEGLYRECPYPLAALIGHIRRDKKAAGEGVRLVLLREPGCCYTEEVRLDELEGFLA